MIFFGIDCQSLSGEILSHFDGLPRCATTAILHLDSALNIKNISTLYKEAHTLTHISTRLKGDKKVNVALDNRITRESAYQRKKSVTVEAEAIFKSAFGLNTVQGEISGTTPEPVSDLTLSTEEGGLNLTLPVPG